MRACMVAYTFYAMDNRVRRYAETLIELGWEVDAIALNSGNEPREETVNGAHVYRIQKRRKNEKSRYTYLLRLLRFLLVSGVFLTIRNFRRKYDLIHIHNVPDFEVFAGIVPRILGSKIILDIHDILPELFTSKFGAKENSALFGMLLLVEKISAAMADHVVIANQIWFDRITHRSVPESKCTVIMNYPSPVHFHRRERKRRDDRFILLYPGALSHHQGIDIAIRAVDSLKNKIPNLEFHIYGNGTDEASLRSLVRDLNLSNYVKFFGIVPIEQVADVMAEADLAVEPKIRNPFSKDAFSTKILEFMMLGIPVVASDTDVHKFYIPDELVKYFRAGDVNDLAESILILHQDGALRRQYVEKATVFMRGNSWGSKKDIYLTLVNRLVRA